MESSDLSVMRDSKRQKVEEGQIDWASQLLESVLVDILSYLPTKDVAKMSALPRFRHIWTYIHSLSFDQCTYHHHYDFEPEYYDGPNYDERFLNLIRHVLILHERSTINKFRLKFAFNLFNVTHDDPDYSDYALKEQRMASELTTWIKFALRKQVKVLDLDLLGCGLPEPEVNYKLPKYVLTSDELMELRLVACGINAQGKIQMKSLKKLFLKEIILDEKIMGEILERCPMLEELSLIGCSGLHKLKLTNPNIKRLNIFIGWRDEVANLRLEINCPCLKSLELAGSIQLAYLKTASSIVEGSLCFSRSFQCERRMYEKIQMLLWKLAETNVFIPCTWTVLVFTIWKLTNVPTPHTGWKHVEFRLLFTKWHLPGICSILKSSRSLETLTFYVYPGESPMYTHDEAKWMEEYDFDGENNWKSLKERGGFPCLAKHLKSVRIFGFVTKPCVFELIEFLLKNALVLEKMVISTKRTIPRIHQYELFSQAVKYQKKRIFDREELLEFSQKLLSLPRASKSAVIQFCC